MGVVVHSLLWVMQDLLYARATIEQAEGGLTWQYGRYNGGSVIFGNSFRGFRV